MGKKKDEGNGADAEKRKRIKRLFFDELHPESFTQVRKKKKGNGTHRY